MTRETTVTRNTRETRVTLRLGLNGTGTGNIRTGIGFLDHLLDTIARHGRMDLALTCDGDLDVDDHHTAEDVALAFGTALDVCLGDRSGIQRFGWALAPLDEALARVAVDLSGRPHATVNLGLVRPVIGRLATENIGHFFTSFAATARATVHVDVLRGTNDHHRAESAAKAFALALRQAVAPSGFDDIASTKGTLGVGP